MRCFFIAKSEFKKRQRRQGQTQAASRHSLSSPAASVDQSIVHDFDFGFLRCDVLAEGSFLAGP
jgi:hypothetical protein